MGLERKRITDQRIIMSLLREGIFLQSSVKLFSHDQIYENCRLMSAQEDGTRKVASTKTVNLSVHGYSENVQSSDIEIEVALPTLVIRFFTKIVSNKPPQIQISVPEEAWFFQRRSDVRNSCFGEAWFPTVIEDGNNAFEVSIYLKDVSKNGYGAIIRTSPELPIPKAGSRIRGTTANSDFYFSLDAIITHCSPIGSTQENGQSQYFVGLTTKHQSQSLEWDTQERRKISRLSVLKDLSVRSLTDGRLINIRMNEASFSGFSCETETPNLTYPPGTAFNLEGTSLIFQLKDDLGSARFWLIQGDQECRIRWMNQVISSHHKDITFSNFQPSELVRLFLEAGAIPNETIERASFYSEQFLKRLTKSTNSSSWFFRMVNLDHIHKKTRGHASAVRISDSTWFLGDIAGGITTESKISPTFIGRFLDSFREFCSTLSPQPYVLGIWKVGHPYWKEFETHLRNTEDLLVGSTFLGHQTLSLLNTQNSSPIECHEIRSDSTRLIKEITSALLTDGRLPFANMLDFNESGFGSPLLQSLTDKDGNREFDRKYFFTKIGFKRCLCILTRLPLGISFNQVATSAYIFPLDEHTDLEWNSVCDAIRAQGLALGCPASAIRRVSSTSGLKYSEESSEIIAYLFRPKAFEFFTKTKKKAA